MKELKQKGLIKINNFKNNPDKSRYLYLLTPKGVAEKTKITIKFMQRKMEEYEESMNENAIALFREMVAEMNECFGNYWDGQQPTS